MTNYVNLHTHTHFSTLDGKDTPATYMQRAKELGMTHLAITDHGTLSGHREFQRAAKEAGVTPILGIEGYVSATDRFDRRSQAKREDGTSVYNHITILAQNETGLKTLNRLSEIAWTEGYYFKPRMDTELIFENNEGIIVLSGCMSGLIAKSIIKEDLFTARMYARQYKEALGDRFFIEVMSTNEASLNHQLLAIADEFGIPPVMTTDCHYAYKDDLWIEEAMLILSTSPKAIKGVDMARSQKMDILERYNYLYPDRTMTFEKIEIYLRDYQTEVEQFGAQGITRKDIYENTLFIADRIGDYPYYQNLDLLPSPDREDPSKSLRSKVRHGLAKMGLLDKPGYVERAEHELSVIDAKKFAVYFLIVADLISWAEAQDILVGPGRGSSAGSLVCYVLGITKVDPIKYGCLFERFLDESREDWPDIDMDFEDKRRGEVKEYLKKKYGYVASIATFNAFGGKSSIKDAARVFRIPLSEVNKATKDNDPPEGVDFYEHFVAAPQSKEFARKYPEVVKLARELNGKNRSMGMHAAGLVLSKEPLERYMPIETAKDPNDKDGPRIPYVAGDMNECADIGAIKLDLLGLKALSVIKDVMRSIEVRHGKRIDPYAIPLDDPKVYEMLSGGYTKGVFQMEQPAYTKLIINMGGVQNFDDLVASNALVRPGAMNTIGKEYIARKMGKKMVTFAHPSIREFTETTYGMVTLFQEQVMKLVQVVGGLTAAESNQLRRGLGKKDVKYIKPFEEKFKQSAVHMISEKEADRLWEDIEAGAGYSFNIAHSVAYSMLGYVTAWLKVNYPLEFMMATISNEKNKDSITDYLLEAKRLGLRILLPHVNESGLHTQIQNEGIRLGLTSIKYIQDKVGSAIIKHRPFESYAHLSEKVAEKGSGMNTRMLSAMNAIGAAAFGDNPKTGRERENFYEYLQIPAFEVKELPPTVKFKFRDIEDYDDDSVFPILGVVRNIKKGEGWARIDVIDETASAGVFAPPDIPMEKGQMYAILVANNRVARYLTMDELIEGTDTEFSKWLRGETPEVPEGKIRIISFRSRMTKAGKKMADIVYINDMGQLQSAMIFPDNAHSRVYSKAFVKCKAGFMIEATIAESQGGGMYVKEIK